MHSLKLRLAIIENQFGYTENDNNKRHSHADRDSFHATSGLTLNYKDLLDVFPPKLSSLDCRANLGFLRYLMQISLFLSILFGFSTPKRTCFHRCSPERFFDYLQWGLPWIHRDDTLNVFLLLVPIGIWIGT